MGQFEGFTNVPAWDSTKDMAEKRLEKLSNRVSSLLEKFNPYHDQLGRFTSSSSGSIGGSKLTGSEIAAVKAWQSIKGFDRIQGAAKKGKATNEVRSLDNAIDKSRTSSSANLSRGLAMSLTPEKAKSLIGKELPAIGFQSLTRDVFTAEDFATVQGTRRGGTVLNVRVPKGSKALDVVAIAGEVRGSSKYGSYAGQAEKEWLLPRTAKFRVVSVSRSGAITYLNVVAKT